MSDLQQKATHLNCHNTILFPCEIFFLVILAMFWNVYLSQKKVVMKFSGSVILPQQLSLTYSNGDSMIVSLLMSGKRVQKIPTDILVLYKSLLYLSKSDLFTD